MIKTMVDYEDMALVYPISIRDYLNEISAYFNLTFKNINVTSSNRFCLCVPSNYKITGAKNISSSNAPVEYM